MEQVLREFIKTAQDLEKILSAIPETGFNQDPNNRGWTAGQVFRHLVKSNGGFLQVINGPVKETHRPPDEWVKKISSDFSDFSIKMESPEPVVPEMKEYDKERMLHSVQEINKGLLYSIQNLDLTKTCTLFRLPVYGLLTRLEAIYFVIAHTKRHLYQLNKFYIPVTLKNNL